MYFSCIVYTNSLGLRAFFSSVSMKKDFEFFNETNRVFICHPYYKSRLEKTLSSSKFQEQ